MTSYPTPMAKATRTPMTTEREKTIGVRVTAEEYELIQKKADAMGLRAAAYVRMLALKDAAPEPAQRVLGNAFDVAAMDAYRFLTKKDKP